MNEHETRSCGCNVSGVRTAVGSFGGSLKDIAPTEVGAKVVREAPSRAVVDGVEVGHVDFGSVIQTEPKDMYHLARVAAIEGGVSPHAPAFTVNRLCGSGLQAVMSACKASCWATPTSRSRAARRA